MKASKKSDSIFPSPRLSESEWRDLSKFVHQAVGIKLSESKRVFLVSRLLKRLRATGARSFRDYFRMVQGTRECSGEHQLFVNAITTNKTDFFREPDHFVVLERWLNSNEPSVQLARKNGLRIWCAAASTGEEPYSIAAVLREHLTEEEYERTRLVASDVDTHVLECARLGVYDKAAIEPVNKIYRTKMFVRGSGDYRDKFRVRRELRRKVQFVRQNLVAPNWTVGRVFDLIFCRNVLIYFDRPTQQRVVTRLLEHTEGYGLLFLGHSESLNSLSIRAKSIAHAVYSPANGRSQAPLKMTTIRPRPSSSTSKLRLSLPTDDAETLQVGACRLKAEKWLTASLNHSILVLVYSVHRKVALVCHLAAMHRRSLAQRLREFIGSMFDELRINGAKAEEFRAKLVLVDEAQCLEITQELVRLGIEVTTVKVVYPDAKVWAKPCSEQILISRRNLPRTGSPSVPFLERPNRP